MALADEVEELIGVGCWEDGFESRYGTWGGGGLGGSRVGLGWGGVVHALVIGDCRWWVE